jgi:hypothetical protein
VKRIAVTSILASAAALSGCAAGVYDAPYSRFVMGSGTPDRLEAPAAIDRIDGQSTDNPRSPYPVVPGTHTILVSFQSPRGVTMIADQLKNLTVEVKPCLIYYVNARYANMTTTDWTPVVGAVELIAECAAKFNIKYDGK